MADSPLNTLTLEDFLESERHKLTGTLTPVTPETFAKWKKDRLSKKAAEQEALKAKEATGRALFESGGWDGDSDSDEDGNADPWNLQAMRKETERLRVAKEEERLARANGGEPSSSYTGGDADGGGGVDEDETGGDQDDAREQETPIENGEP